VWPRLADLPLFWQVENGYTLLVPIFKQFHKNIIGKGGANIKKVRRWTDAGPDGSSPAHQMS